MKIKYNFNLIKALQTYHNIQVKFKNTTGQRVMLTQQEWDNLKYLMYPYTKMLEKNNV